MSGNNRVRFCDQCSLHVYNLSAMTRRDAERLVMNTEGRLCVRFYRRADGTILTQNCPQGLRALKQHVSRVLSATLTAALSFCASVGLYSWVGVGVEPIPAMMKTMPQEEQREPVAPPLQPIVPVEEVMGTFAARKPGEWTKGEVIMR
jgi:hypothetical protein